MLPNLHIILASQSPRRRQLIESLGLPVSIVNIQADETIDADTPIHAIAETTARHKADGYDEPLLTNHILVTADTIVALNDTKLGKPHDRQQAIEMLQSLSGKTHTVYTGVNLRWNGGDTSFTESTSVHFRVLTTDEMEYYVDTYRPFDKAGAYGIQEWIGMIGISSIEGDYYNVMGLPLCTLYQKLIDISTSIN